MAELTKEWTTYALRFITPLLLASLTWIGNQIRETQQDISRKLDQTQAEISRGAQRDARADQIDEDTTERVKSLEDWRRNYYEFEIKSRNHEP